MYKPVCIGCKFDVKYRHCVILACNTRMYHTDTSFCIHTGTAISYDSLLLSCLRGQLPYQLDIQYISSGGFRGGKGGCKCTPLWRLVMYFCVHNCKSPLIMQQWHAATTTRHSYTLTYQFLTNLQTFD